MDWISNPVNASLHALSFSKADLSSQLPPYQRQNSSSFKRGSKIIEFIETGHYAFKLTVQGIEHTTHCQINNSAPSHIFQTSQELWDCETHRHLSRLFRRLESSMYLSQ